MGKIDLIAGSSGLSTGGEESVQKRTSPIYGGQAFRATYGQDYKNLRPQCGIFE